MVSLARLDLDKRLPFRFDRNRTEPRQRLRRISIVLGLPF